MISVIVPVYNIEKYIKKCICSIINQTYKDLEIIIVDDGSNDRSGQICDEFAGQDERIIVIHKENGGLSSARNVGLDIARGEYIGFVDGDDYISERMYETLLCHIESNNADMVICGYREIKEENRGPEDSKLVEETETVISGEDRYKLITDFDTENIVAWSKLYKKNIFDGLRFNIGKLHEDQWIIPYVIEKAEKIIKINDELYCYVARENSISKEKMKPQRMWDLFDALRNASMFFKNKNLYKEQKEEARHLCNYIIDYYLEANSLFEHPHVIKAQLKTYFRDVIKECNNVFSFKQVTYQCFSICPPIGIMIKKIREKNV